MSTNIELAAFELEKVSNDLKYNVALQLLYTGLLIDRYFNQMEAEHGINRPKMDILHTLVAHGKTMKQLDLSKIMRSKQAVNQVLNGLERDGLVLRQVSDKDKRTKMVTITPKGIRIVRKNLPNALLNCNEVVSPLTEKETYQLKSILKKVRQHIMPKINYNKSFKY